MCSWWRSRWNSSVNWKGLKKSAWTDHFWRRTNGEHHQENVLHWQHFKFSAFKKKIPPQDSAFLNCNSLELWLLPLTLLVCYYSSTLFHPRFLLLPASSSHPSHPLFFFSPQFLNIEEITTCRYNAVVSTRQLCQNKAYRFTSESDQSNCHIH